MITVELKSGERVLVKPRSLHNYIEKTDYIKLRRISPYRALRDLPKAISEANYSKFVEIAVTAAMKLSSVPFDEELPFDGSLEGFYYSVWQGLRGAIKWPEDPLAAVAEAAKWFTSLDDDDQTQVRMALRGVDQRALIKNSNGLGETATPGPDPEDQPTS